MRVVIVGTGRIGCGYLADVFAQVSSKVTGRPLAHSSPAAESLRTGVATSIEDAGCDAGICEVAICLANS